MSIYIQNVDVNYPHKVIQICINIRILYKKKLIAVWYQVGYKGIVSFLNVTMKCYDCKLKMETTRRQTEFNDSSKLFK